MVTAASILVVEDSLEDYLLTLRLIGALSNKQIYCEREWVLGRALKKIQMGIFDICLLDYNLGIFTGIELLEALAQNEGHTSIIFLTGRSQPGLDEQAMELGATDYLVKGEITAEILERSLRYAIARKRAEEERNRLSLELQQAMKSDLKRLKGLLPICSCCKKIRDDHGYWNQLEAYIRDHSDADFTHGICPGCAHGMLAARPA